MWHMPVAGSTFDTRRKKLNVVYPITDTIGESEMRLSTISSVEELDND